MSLGNPIKIRNGPFPLEGIDWKEFKMTDTEYEDSKALRTAVARVRSFEELASNHYEPPEADPYKGMPAVTSVDDRNEIVNAYLDLVPKLQAAVAEMKVASGMTSSSPNREGDFSEGIDGAVEIIRRHLGEMP